VLKKSRTNEILMMLRRDGEVQVDQLCRMFGVTEMTIRRDLNSLAGEPNITRTHGGAIYEEAVLTEPSYESRIKRASETKLVIAKKALELISDDEIIFLDSGSTCFYLASLFPVKARNTIITNSITTASEIIARNDIKVIVIGGELHRNTNATRGSLSEAYLSSFHFDVSFIGANAIDDNGMVYVANTSEIGIKKAAIENAKNVYLLADSSKFGKTSLVAVGNAKKFSGIITDKNIDGSIYDKLKEKEVNIIKI